MRVIISPVFAMTKQAWVTGNLYGEVRNHNLLLASLKRLSSWSLGAAHLLCYPWMQIGSHLEEAGSSEV